MIYRRSINFREDFERLPPDIQDIARQKFRLFQDNPRHPSLRIKKMAGREDIWEGHITQAYVFTFQWLEDPQTGEAIAYFRRIGSHQIYDNP
jgi:mRNA interferase RelE/StbE